MFIDSLSQMVFFPLQETNSGHRILISLNNNKDPKSWKKNGDTGQQGTRNV